MKFNRVLVVGLMTGGLVIGASGLSGCNSASRALGMTKVTPDEFRVVTKAPLVVPPDYGLRPPAPGEPRPQELQPESAARNALLGQREGQDRSEGERLLATKAGSDHADPLIRFVVDDEFGDVAHKDKGFADWVMFWKKGNPAADTGPAPDPAATTPAPINASTEDARIKSLTGNQPIVIARQHEAKLKLPGL